MSATHPTPPLTGIAKPLLNPAEHGRAAAAHNSSPQPPRHNLGKAAATAIRPTRGTAAGMRRSKSRLKAAALVGVPRGVGLRDADSTRGQRRAEASASSAFAAMRCRSIAR